jgi:hypothetical protein
MDRFVSVRVLDDDDDDVLFVFFAVGYPEQLRLRASGWDRQEAIGACLARFGGRATQSLHTDT